MENEKMERTKNVPYLGGMIKFRPAGSYVDENTKEEKSYGDAVKVCPGSREDMVLSLEAVRTLYTAIRTDTDLQAFIGV